MDLFKKIIDQVKNPWGVRIVPYFNNEPFLDPFFFDRLGYINEKCPGAEIEISTNVSRLNADYQKRLEEYEIEDLRLSVFGFSERSYKEVMPNLNWKDTKTNLESIVKNKDLRAKIARMSLIMVDYPGLIRTEVQEARDFCRDNYIKFEFWGFLDRSGNVEKFSNEISKTKVFGCEQRRPLERMHINFKGDIVLCCMDWKWEHVLGNVADNLIEEVWNSKAYQQYREAIYFNGDEKKTRLCRKCKLAL